MNLKDVEKILASGKSQTVDFFSDEEWDAIAETACAFANSGGGTIVIGAANRLNESVSEGFRFDGIPVDRGVYNQIRELGGNLKPPVKSEFDEVAASRSGFSVFVVTIAKSTAEEPVSLANGNVFVRKGQRNEPGSIFKPKTAKEHAIAQDVTASTEQSRIASAILATNQRTLNASRIAEQTGISLERTEGHLERLMVSGAISNITRTGDGALVTVTPGNRLTLEEIAGATTSKDRGSPVTEKRSEDQRGNEPGDQSAQERPKDGDDQQSGGRGKSVSASNSLGLTQKVEATVTPGPIGGAIRISRESIEACLDADSYAEIIANLLANTSDNESMTFAIFGHWGRGKTYQMKRIVERLKRIVSPGPQYSIVWFSAWKYRTTPETWAYLFEQFLRAAKATHFGLPFRAGLQRRGIRPLLLALTTVAVTLPTFAQKLSVANIVLQAVGIGTALYVVFMFLRFRTIAVRLWSLYSFAGHADQLGLQAAIGDDLRSLLLAWVAPNPRDDAPTDKDGESGWRAFGASVVRSVVRYSGPLCLVIVSASISFQLVPDSIFGLAFDMPNSLEWTDKIRLAGHLHPLALGALFLGWTSLWLGTLFLFARPSRKKRVLLVVDDLDRCEPHQMLEIIESTMLILDDEEIRQRLQIAMLIDDVAFEHALVRKYKDLVEGTVVTDTAKYDIPRIVRENQEKFFLMQFRLPVLGEAEIAHVATTFLKELIASTVQSTEADSAAPPASKTEVEQATGSVEVQHPTFTNNVLEKHECDAITDALKNLSSSDSSLVIGPRTVRCMMHRYQLAREILRQLGRPARPHELARAVVDAYAGGGKSDDTLIDTVAKQVS